MLFKLSFTQVITLLAAFTTALSAGLFYSYSCSVNPGLGKLSDRHYLLAMQSINLAILNPVFFIGFMGTLLLLPLSSYLNYDGQITPRFIWLLTAFIIYAIGVFGITMFCNVPLNEALANFDITGASDAEITIRRKAFEAPWLLWHGVRT